MTASTAHGGCLGVQKKMVESLAHARLAKDLLRKKLGEHPLFEGCSKVRAAICPAADKSPRC
jgi:hypothetical protein